MIINSSELTKIKAHKSELKKLGLKIFEPKKVYIPLKDGKWELDFTPKTGSIVKKGQIVGTWTNGLHAFSSVEGKVVGKSVIHNSRNEVIDAIAIEARPGEAIETFKPLDPSTLEKEGFIARIKEAAIVGMGGSGFPSHIKYSSKKIEHIIVNAVECEPFLVSDYYELKTQADKMISILGAMARMFEVPKIQIAIKKVNKVIIDILTEEIEKQSLEGKIVIKKLPNKYPMGYERQIIKKVLKMTYALYPTEINTVVSNSTTLIKMYDAVVKGLAPINRIVTFAGNGLSEPVIVDVPMGSTFGDVLKEYTKIDKEKVNVYSGGPMMGSSLKDLNVPITLANNGLVVQEVVANKELPCLSCGKCTMSCPMHLQPKVIREDVDAKKFDTMVDLCSDKCISCGTCNAVCPSNIMLREKVELGKKIAKIKIAQMGANEVNK